MVNPMYDEKDILFSLSELHQERRKAVSDFYPTRRKALDIAIFFLEKTIIQRIEQEDDFFKQETQ